MEILYPSRPQGVAGFRPSNGCAFARANVYAPGKCGGRALCAPRAQKCRACTCLPAPACRQAGAGTCTRKVGRAGRGANNVMKGFAAFAAFAAFARLPAGRQEFAF